MWLWPVWVSTSEEAWISQIMYVTCENVACGYVARKCGLRPDLGIVSGCIVVACAKKYATEYRLQRIQTVAYFSAAQTQPVSSAPR